MADALLRIGELSRRSGYSADVIRAWERRYDLLRPSRTQGGYRLYSADDISRLRLMRDSLERFDDGPADRTLERLLGVFAPGAVLRDVVLPYLREVGERWACGEATVAQEHFASNFLEGWMHTMARGWNRSGPYRAVLACVP